MLNVNRFWDLLKRQCCATRPDTPEFDKVTTVVSVRKKDLEKVLDMIFPTQAQIEEAISPGLIDEIRKSEQFKLELNWRDKLAYKDVQEAAAAVLELLRKVNNE